MALGQAFSPDLLKDVPAELSKDLIPGGVLSFGRGGSRSSADTYQVKPEYAKYAVKNPVIGMGGLGGQGQAKYYEIPTGKTYQDKPLVARYDTQGNFQFVTFPEDQYLRVDPSNPAVISQPKINKNGEIIDYGINVQGDFGGSGLGGFVSDLVSDFGPMALAALGANYFAPAAGAAAAPAAAGAGAAGALSPYAAQAAGAYGGSAAAAGAAAAGNLAGIQAASTAQNALTHQAVNNLGLTFGQGVTPTPSTPTPTPSATTPTAPDQVAGMPASEVTQLPPEVAAETTASASDIAANDALAQANRTAQAAGGFTPAAATGLLSSLGDVGTAIMDFATKNPSIAGSLLGAVTGAIGAANAPKEATTQSNIDPQLKAEYLANIERAKQTAAGLEARQFAEPGAMYTDAEKRLYNLGMTPFGAEDIARFYNPYQEQVVQGALGDIERTRQIQEQANMEQATRARAFGGSRQGVVSGMTNEAALRQAATTGAQLRSAGFNTAANLGLAARPLDIAGLQTSLGLGTARTALEQARLDALRNLGTERLAITSGSLGIGIPNIGGSTSQPLYSNTAGSALSGGLTGAYIGSLLQPRQT